LLQTIEKGVFIRTLNKDPCDPEHTSWSWSWKLDNQYNHGVQRRWSWKLRTNLSNYSFTQLWSSS